MLGDTTKTITGVVMEEGGTPVPFAFVSLYSKKDSTLIAGEMSDERGRFLCDSRVALLCSISVVSVIRPSRCL